jgi:thioredoxin 1
MNMINTTQFNELTQAGSGKQIVVFSASWCGPCKMLTPVLDTLSKEYTNVTFSKIDIEEEQELTISLGIKGVPTVMFFDNGEIKYKHVGASSASVMKNHIDTYLS